MAATAPPQKNTQQKSHEIRDFLSIMDLIGGDNGHRTLFQQD